jgi:O-methyltransferase involved in polyketide biosynthesis
MDKEKIVFTKEKETLLIPLYGKALESKKQNPILKDPKAEEIIEKIEYDFKQLHIPEKTDVMMSLRAK